LLEAKDDDITIVKYLEIVPTKQEFEKVLAKLNLRPTDILRKGEAIYKEQFKTLEMNDHEWIEIMLENPKLIERPIVIKGNKAVVARPAELIDEL
jgi:arsenate reductase